MYEVDDNLVNNKEIIQTLKQSFYHSVYLLLHDYQPPFMIYLLFIAIQTLQMVYFRFDNLVINSWGDPLADKIQSVFGCFNYVHYLNKLKFPQFEICFFASFGIIILWCILFSMIFTLIQNQKEKQISYFLVITLKYITYLILYVLMIPFLNTFTVMISCQSGKLQKYPSEICWQGTTIIDQILAIISIVLLICFTLLFSCFFFSPLYVQQNPISRRNGKCFFISTISNQAIVIITTVLNPTSYVACIIAQLIISLFNYFYCKENDAYNYRLIQKLVQGFKGIQLWTSIMLGISAFFQGNFYVQGSIYIWLVSIPVVFITLVIQVNNREKSLMITITNTLDIQILIDHINEVLKLIEMDKKKLGNGILNGYIEFHNQWCNNPSCPLQKVKFCMNLYKKQVVETGKTDKRYQIIYDMISKLYLAGMGRFQDNQDIKINYSLFLLQTLKSKQQALDELSKIGDKKTTMEQQYIIFYIKKIIETEIAEVSGEGDEFTEQRDFDERLNEFKLAIERSVILLMEFWTQLGEDKPDLVKLYEIGSKLFPLRIYVDNLWKPISRSSNPSLPKALRLYSKYIIDIFNDRQLGIELQQKALSFEQKLQQRTSFKLVLYHKYHNIKQGASSNISIDGIEDGIIFIALEEDRFGQIYAINNSAASQFGFDKNEVLNKKVNNLMPSLYARNHDNFLRRFIETNEASLLNKERQLMGKHRSSYIFRFTVMLRPVYHVLKEGVEFVANIKKEKIIKDLGFLILNKKLIIEDISSSCMNLLGIEHKTLSFGDFKITDLFPQFEDKLNSLLTRNGQMIEYFPQKNEDKNISNIVSNENSIKLIVQVQPINFLILKTSENDSGLAGYQMRIERYQEQNNSVVNQNKSLSNNDIRISSIQQKENSINQSALIEQVKQIKVDSNQNQSFISVQQGIQINQKLVPLVPNFIQFQFKLLLLDTNIILFVGEKQGDQITDNATQIIETESIFIQDRNQNRQYTVKTQKSDKKEIIDYAEGIRTLRLYASQIQDIEKFQGDSDIEQEDIEEQNQQLIMEGEQNQEISGSFSQESVIKSIKDLKEALVDKIEGRAIKCLSWSLWIFFFGLIVLSVIFYFFTKNEVDQSNLSWSLMVKIGQMISELGQIVMYTRSLVFLNLGIYDYSLLGYQIQTLDQISFEDILIKTQMQEVISNFDKVSQDVFQQNSIYALVNLIDSISSLSSQQNVIEYATHGIITKAYQISQTNLFDISYQNNTDVFFVIYNGLNDYAVSLQEYYSLQVKEGITAMDNLKNQILIILLLSLAVIILTSIIIIGLLRMTLLTREEILKVYLNIPNRTAKKLFTKCELFLQQINQNEQDEVQSDDEEWWLQDRNGSEENVSLLGKKQKRFTNNQKSGIGLIVKIISFSALIESYFVLNYLLDYQYINTQAQIFTEFNKTALIPGYLSILENIVKITLYNDSIALLNQQNASSALLEQIISCWEFTNSDFQSIHSQNSLINPINYNINFNNIMFRNVCDSIIDTKNVTQNCYNFSGGILTHGLQPALSTQTSNLNFLQNQYNYLKQNISSLEFQTQFTMKNISSDYITNIQYNILRQPAAFETNIFINFYLNQCLKQLQIKYIQEMQLYYEQFIVQQLIMLLVYILVIFFALLFFFDPFLATLNQEIWSTKCLLTFIPVDELVKIKNINNYIRTILLNQSI